MWTRGAEKPATASAAGPGGAHRGEDGLRGVLGDVVCELRGIRKRVVEHDGVAHAHVLQRPPSRVGDHLVQRVQHLQALAHLRAGYWGVKVKGVRWGLAPPAAPLKRLIGAFAGCKHSAALHRPSRRSSVS